MPSRAFPGSLRRHSLSEEERYLFLTIMASKLETDQFDILGNVFDEQLLMFLDIFSGETIRIPPRTDVERWIRMASVYHYVASHVDRESAIQSIARISGVGRKEIEGILKEVDLLKGDTSNGS